MKWSSQQTKPANWDPRTQITRAAGLRKKKR